MVANLRKTAERDPAAVRGIMKRLFGRIILRERGDEVFAELKMPFRALLKVCGSGGAKFDGSGGSLSLFPRAFGIALIELAHYL
jgi:hypothetical protein